MNLEGALAVGECHHGCVIGKVVRSEDGLEWISIVQPRGPRLPPELQASIVASRNVLEHDLALPTFVAICRRHGKVTLGRDELVQRARRFETGIETRLPRARGLDPWSR